MAFPLIFGLHVAGTSQNVFYICRWKACFWPISAVLKRSSESQTKWLTSISVFCSFICFLTRKSELPCDGSKGEQFILALESLNPSPRRTSFCLSRVIKIEATAFWIYLVWTSSVEHQASGEAPSGLCRCKLQIQSIANWRLSQAGVAKPRVAYSLLLKNEHVHSLKFETSLFKMGVEGKSVLNYRCTTLLR